MDLVGKMSESLHYLHQSITGRLADLKEMYSQAKPITQKNFTKWPLDADEAEKLISVLRASCKTPKRSGFVGDLRPKKEGVPSLFW